MKIIKNILYIIISFIIIYILQIKFFNYFTIAEIKPNLFIIFMIFIGLNNNKYLSGIIGIIIGIIIDLLIGNIIGINAILYGVLGYTIYFMQKNISKESKISNILIIMITTFIFGFLQYFCQIIFYNNFWEIIIFLKINIIESIYNGIIMIIIYPFWKKINKLEIEVRGSRYI